MTFKKHKNNDWFTPKLAYCASSYIYSFGNITVKKVLHSLLLLSIAFSLSGCIAVAVVSTAVSATTTVVGGAIDVVDAVTPDIIDDEDEDDGDNE